MKDRSITSKSLVQSDIMGRKSTVNEEKIKRMWSTYDIIKKHGLITSSQIMTLTGFAHRTVNQYIHDLRKMGYIEITQCPKCDQEQSMYKITDKKKPKN